MKRMSALWFVAISSVAVTACGSSGDGGTAPATGPLAMGIISGNDQLVNAGAAQLGAPVVGRMVRLPNGQLSLHIESPAERVGSRLLDLLVPRANAQTVVTGSPVPGAVVCAVSVDSVHKLTPFTPCTTTDATGKATFFFTPSTTAGVATAQIRGTLNNSPAVFDTAKAIVGPDTASLSMRVNFDSIGPGAYSLQVPGFSSFAVRTIHAGDSLRVAGLAGTITDKYGNVGPDSGTVGWTLTQFTHDTITVTGSTDNSGTPPTVTPAPSAAAVSAALAAPTAPPATTGTYIRGFAAGYAVLDLYFRGKLQTVIMYAVLP